MRGGDAVFSRKSDEWETPGWLFDRLDQNYKFEFDAAAQKHNALCAEWSNDSLTLDWTIYENIWLNPPYSRVAEFVEKAYLTAEEAGSLVVCLVPARTDTRWWHEFALRSDAIWFVRGRLRFSESKNSAPFPSVVVRFGDSLVSCPTIGSIEKPKEIKK